MDAKPPGMQLHHSSRIAQHILTLLEVNMDNNRRIWRSFSIGSLFGLIMLDTRNYDRSITTLGWDDEYIADISNDAGRILMGSEQENW